MSRGRSTSSSSKEHRFRYKVGEPMSMIDLPSPCRNSIVSTPRCFRVSLLQCQSSSNLRLRLLQGQRTYFYGVRSILCNSTFTGVCNPLTYSLTEHNDFLGEEASETIAFDQCQGIQVAWNHVKLLQHVMVLDYKLTYLNGTATTMLINSFHTNTGVGLARYTGTR